MTTINTALAAGMLPLNLWIYGGSWSATTAAIPYRNIAEAFALVVFPAAAGILLRWKRAKLAAVLIKVCDTKGYYSLASCRDGGDLNWQ